MPWKRLLPQCIMTGAVRWLRWLLRCYSGETLLQDSAEQMTALAAYVSAAGMSLCKSSVRRSAEAEPCCWAQLRKAGDISQLCKSGVTQRLLVLQDSAKPGRRHAQCNGAAGVQLSGEVQYTVQCSAVQCGIRQSELTGC